MPAASTSGQYDGVNFVCADAESGWVIQGGNELESVELEDGLSIVSNGDVNDHRDERGKLARRLLTLQTLDSPVKFLAVASKVFARPAALPDRPSMVTRGSEKGTVSSTLIALGKKPRDAIFQHASDAPDRARRASASGAEARSPEDAAPYCARHSVQSRHLTSPE